MLSVFLSFVTIRSRTACLISFTSHCCYCVIALWISEYWLCNQKLVDDLLLVLRTTCWYHCVYLFLRLCHVYTGTIWISPLQSGCSLFLAVVWLLWLRLWAIMGILAYSKSQRERLAFPFQYNVSCGFVTYHIFFLQHIPSA